MVGRRQCLRQHSESSFFGSAGEGGREGEKRGGGEEKEEGRKGSSCDSSAVCVMQKVFNLQVCFQLWLH